MDWTMWPQWIAFVALLLPVISWPAVRSHQNKPFDAKWVELYLAKCIHSGIGGFVLYMGGFWS